jgi:hypothetical protein
MSERITKQEIIDKGSEAIPFDCSSVLQVLTNKDRDQWSDYSTIKDSIDAAIALILVQGEYSNHPRGDYRIRVWQCPDEFFITKDDLLQGES